MEFKLIWRVVELFNSHTMNILEFDFDKPIEVSSIQLRGMVLETIDAVFLMVPDILKQEKDMQHILFNLISKKINEYFESCLNLITRKFNRPESFPTESNYSSIYNFLTILIDKSNQFIKSPDSKALLELGIYAAIINNKELSCQV